MILNCNALVLDLSKPVIMGILNVTPDSFFDGQDSHSEQEINARISKIFDDGAEIIDIGGMSSRPGAKIIDHREEWNRIEYALNYCLNNYPNKLVSVDTLHAQTAEKAINQGVHIINDISGGTFDKDMFRVVGQSKAAYVMMHMRSNPENMQYLTDYPKGIIVELLQFFENRIYSARKYGIKDIIIDPGFGFSKTINQNFFMLNRVGNLRILECPILVGISRKSTIYKTLGLSPKEALNGTTALHMKALLQGAHILRVHDVKEAKEVVDLHQKLVQNDSEPK